MTEHEGELVGGGIHDGIRFEFDTNRDIVGVATFTREPGPRVAASFGLQRGMPDESAILEQITDAVCELAIRLCEQRP